MASYVPGNTAIQGFAAPTLETIELRVISNLLLNDMGPQKQQETLMSMRNNEAFELGINPPVVPGQ